MGISRCYSDARLFGTILFAFIVCTLTPTLTNAQEQVRVGSIFISGNTETPDHILHAVILFRPGQAVTLADLQFARMRLLSLGFWDMPRVEVHVPNENGFADVWVIVQEKPLNWLLLNIGYELHEFCTTGDLDYLGGALTRFNRQLQERVSP